MTSISHGMLSAAIEPTIVQLPLRGMNGAHILVASATDHEHLRRPLKEALVRTAVLNALRSRTDGDLSTLVDVSAGSYGNRGLGCSFFSSQHHHIIARAPANSLVNRLCGKFSHQPDLRQNFRNELAVVIHSDYGTFRNDNCNGG